MGVYEFDKLGASAWALPGSLYQYPGRLSATPFALIRAA